MRKTDEITVMTEWHERVKPTGRGGHNDTMSIAE